MFFTISEQVLLLPCNMLPNSINDPFEFLIFNGYDNVLRELPNSEFIFLTENKNSGFTEHGVKDLGTVLLVQLDDDHGLHFVISQVLAAVTK